MTISKAEADRRGLTRVTEWRDRKTATRAGLKEYNYLDYLCDECLRLGRAGIDAEVVHGDYRVDHLVALFRKQEEETKSWQRK